MSIGRYSAVGLATNVTVLGLGIILSIVLTRSLGPEQRGVYVLLVTTNTLLGSVAHLTLGGAFSTVLARAQYTLGMVNLVAVAAALGMGLVCLAGTTAVFPFISDSIFRGVPYSYLLVALLLIPCTLYQSYWGAMMTGLGRLILFNKVNLAINFANALLMILAVGVFQLGLPGFLVAWVIVSASGMLAMVVTTVRIQRFVWPQRAAVRELVGFGLRQHGATIAQQLFLRFDMFAVNALLSTRAVGFYSLSTSLAEKLWVLPNAIAPSSMSRIAQLPPQESALLTAKVTRTAILAMLVAAIAGAAISPWLVPFLYGPEFSASVLPLIILLFGTPGFAAMLVVNNYVVGQMRRPGLLSIISWLELGISLPLYLVFISWLGIVGGAIASTLTYALGMAGTLYVFSQHSKLPMYMALIPQPGDFQDYIRVIRGLMLEVPILSRLRRRAL